MIRSAIIIALVNYCAFLFSQPVSFSRNFEARRKNIPIAIINNHSRYFHVLRYNKDVHDFTLERRVKPSAEIIAFTPLKMDSVNAHWFDYENLDYLIYENNHKIYFVFEKLTNYKREIFMKIIDTLGKSTGFIELSFLDLDKNMESFNFDFKLTAGNRILITGTQDYLNSTTKHIAMLYDPEKREKIWMKKLPLENPSTGYSYGYDCNNEGDLFYFLMKSEITSYKRKYVDNRQVSVPVFSYNSLFIVSMLKESLDHVRVKEIPISGSFGLNTVTLFPSDTGVSTFVHYSQVLNSDKEDVFLFSGKWDNDLQKVWYSHVTPLNSKLKEQLTFYDGTDYNYPADKEYSFLKRGNDTEICDVLCERRDANYYKELLFFRMDRSNGMIINQELIPRKIYDDKTRFKNIEVVANFKCGTNMHFVVLENKSNVNEVPGKFVYNEFSKQKSFSGNMVFYTLKSGGGMEKKVYYENAGFDFIPLKYYSDQCDFIFYLNRYKFEKFGFADVSK